MLINCIVIDKVYSVLFQLHEWIVKFPSVSIVEMFDNRNSADDKNAMRAVGLANGRNPISIVVPCHRVIGADGSLTGYGGGLQRKEWLLKHEGALLI